MEASPRGSVFPNFIVFRILAMSIFAKSPTRSILVWKRVHKTKYSGVFHDDPYYYFFVFKCVNYVVVISSSKNYALCVL